MILNPLEEIFGRLMMMMMIFKPDEILPGS